MAKIEFENIDILPLCSHCERELDKIYRVHKGIFSTTVVYICPHCRKILSIGYEH